MRNIFKKCQMLINFLFGDCSAQYHSMQVKTTKEWSDGDKCFMDWTHKRVETFGDKCFMEWHVPIPWSIWGLMLQILFGVLSLRTVIQYNDCLEHQIIPPTSLTTWPECQNLLGHWRQVWSRMILSWHPVVEENSKWPKYKKHGQLTSDCA